jgi:signal transduction histidine kinase
MQLFASVRRHRDLLVAVALAIAYAVELLAYPNTDDAIVVPLAIGTGLMLALRRRAPFATFLIVLILNFAVLHWAAPGFDGESVTFVFIFLFNLYSLGANARGVEAWLGVVGVLACTVSFVIGDGAHDASDIVFAILFCGSPWAAGVVVRLRVDRERELNARNLALQQENERAIATERARIARELHDVVSHAIAVTVLQSRGGRKMVGRDDDAVRRALAAIEQTNTSALADMRRLLALLRETDDDPARAEPQPSLERLDDLVEQVRSSGLPVDLEVTGDPLPVPPGLDLSAYRIVQESLTNVLKHAGPGARARVELTYGAEELEVAVTNSGITSPANSNGGQGLIGIRERVGVAGGSVEAGPADGGYAVRARLPYLLGTS